MNKVKPGEPIEIAASTWNSFIDAAAFMNKIATNMSSNNPFGGLSQGVVLVKNTTGKDLDIFATLILDGSIATVIETTDDSTEEGKEEKKPFSSRLPCFNGVAPSDNNINKPFVVLVEPLKSEEIGRAVIFGLVVGKISIEDGAHEFAAPDFNGGTCTLVSSFSGGARILWKGGDSGDQWVVLLLGASGSGGSSDIVLCEVSSKISEVAYRVYLYENGMQEGYTSRGELFFPELALGSELPGGTFIVGHKCFTNITGGNDE